MRDLDDTDREILRLLLEDARRPYADIAERVDLSPPAVSDRVDRLRELGVVRRFTVDLDRSTLREGVPVLVSLTVDPGAVDDLREDLAGATAVEGVFVAAEPRIVVQARVPGGDVREFLAKTIDTEPVREIDVTLLTDAEWTPGIDGATFALDCAECGNTVTAEGESARIGGERYHFCCSSCHSRFAERHAELSEDA